MGSLGRIDVQHAQKGWSDGGMPGASPMPKSVSFLRHGKRSTVDGFVIAYLSSVFIVGDHDDFPC